VGLSAAAAVIVAVVLGFTALGLNTSNNSKSATSSSGARAESAVPAPSAIAGVTITASGMNYTASNLSTFEAHSPNAISGGLPAAPDTGTKAAQPTFDLQRLHSTSELSACLTAVTAAHGGTVTAVDFARYNGQSALIVTLTDPGLRVAAGPNCGLPNSGADELASAPVR
jgi:hypothetical protein